MSYNQANYNEQRYNINGTFHVAALSETVTEIDNTQTVEFLQALADSLSSADGAVFFTFDQMLNDFMFMDELFQIQFSNKALNDTVRLADWLSIERNPAQNGWFD